MNKKFIVSIGLLVLSPALVFPMAEAMMHEAAKAHTAKGHTAAAPTAPADKRPGADHKPEMPGMPHTPDPMHKAMHDTMKDHHVKSAKHHAMPIVPKIDPIPPMHHNKPHELGMPHIGASHDKPHLLGHGPDKPHILGHSPEKPHMPGMPHTPGPMDHISTGHSKIQVAIDSMHKGIASMQEAVGNLSSVQTSIEKIKKAISDLLNTHLSSIG